MINFYPGFLDQRNLDEDRARDKTLEKEIAEIEERFKDDLEGEQKAMRDLYAAHPIYNPPYTRIVDHIDHVRDVAGIDFIGIGSDYDGVPGLPEGMNGAEDHVLITYEMLRRGYSEQDILKVLGENFMRVFKKAEDVAKIKTREISGEGSQKKLN
jgi:membrane dipeptidase